MYILKSTTLPPICTKSNCARKNRKQQYPNTKPGTLIVETSI